MNAESKKIFVNKNDDAAMVAEKVIDASDADIVLNIPRFSRIAQSESNFHLLKRESDALGKRIFIETVDDKVIELAQACGIAATNPFFVKPDKQFSDIVTAPKIKRAMPEVTLVKSARKMTAPKIVLPRESADEIPANIPTASQEEVAAELEAEFGPVEETAPRRSKARLAVMLVSVLLFSGALSFLALQILPRAAITIVRTRVDWPYADAMTVNKSLATIDAATMSVPGQLFTEKKNAFLTFPATGKKPVTKKASGNIIIYNALSSEPQKLVASTRFSAPDGKIFRLVSAVVVPGAKIADGKIVPSSVTAAVVSDAAGAEFNLPPVDKFTIPGFSGTPKYGTFYGESKESMKGGYVGEAAYPTDEDIRKAKATAASTLEDALKAAVLAKVPKEFKIIDGSTQFKLVKQTVDTNVNDAGAFGIYADAEMNVMAFREGDALDALGVRSIAEQKTDDYEILSKTLDYGLARLDVASGKMTFSVNYKSTLSRTLNVNDLKSRVMNKSERELKAMVLALPGLESAKISLWPFYVRSVPADAAKVAIDVK